MDKAASRIRLPSIIVLNSIRASLLTKRTTFGVQRSPYCIATVPLLEGKNTTFETKQRVFTRHSIAHPTLSHH